LGGGGGGGGAKTKGRGPRVDGERKPIKKMSRGGGQKKKKRRSPVKGEKGGGGPERASTIGASPQQVCGGGKEKGYPNSVLWKKKKTKTLQKGGVSWFEQKIFKNQGPRDGLGDLKEEKNPLKVKVETRGRYV